MYSSTRDISQAKEEREKESLSIARCSRDMGSSCRRCKLRAENAYKNLNDMQKYFLIPLKGDFQREVTIPGELVERFRCEIPAQITLRTRNCNCSIVEAAKYPDKIVISAGWATFVDTYDLHMDGSVLFRYDGNSQFNVIIFDQFGCEEALSILQDYADLPRHDPERCINATEAMKCCERCKDLDDYKYYHLDNEEKYFVVFMKSDFQNEMIVPVQFVKRFKGEFPGEIKLETRNGESYCVGVVEQPDKVSFLAGWGVFVKTYDLHTGDSLVFKYNGNSKFNVIILSRVGCEKAISVVRDESVPVHVQKRSRDDIESVNPAHDHTETMPIRSPRREIQALLQVDCIVQGNKANLIFPATYPNSSGNYLRSDNDGCQSLVNYPYAISQKTHLSDNKKKILERVQCINSGMPISANVMTKSNVLDPSGCEKVPPCFVTNNEISCGQRREEPNDISSNYANMLMEISETEKKAWKQRDGSKATNISSSSSPSASSTSSGGSTSSEEHEAHSVPRYILPQRTSLTNVQKKNLEEKVEAICSEIPIYGCVMKKSNISGKYQNMCFSGEYSDAYLPFKERVLKLHRDGKNWEVMCRTQVRNGHHSYKRLFRGWARFARDNNLQIGDLCLFELLNTKEGTMNVHIVREK